MPLNKKLSTTFFIVFYSFIGLSFSGAFLWKFLSKTNEPQQAFLCDAHTEFLAIMQQHQMYLDAITTQEPPIRLSILIDQLNSNMIKTEFGYQAPQFRVVKNTELEGKQVGINTILISEQFLEPGAFTDDELIAMLAHEVYHIIHRDIEKSACAKADELSAMQKQAELSADQSAQTFLAKNGFDPKSMISLLSKINKRYPNQVNSESSTHPTMTQRISRLSNIQ